MNVITEQTDLEVLRGKQILFVDDRPQTLAFFQAELKDALGENGKIVNAKTLQEAVNQVETLTKNACGLDMVVIDLNMPGDLPEELKQFGGQIDPDLNEGQTLGLWLNQAHSDIPYLYLSAVPDAYCGDFGDAPAAALINKFEQLVYDFPGRLAAVLRQVSRNVVAAA